MAEEILRIDPRAIRPEIIERAADRTRGGGLVAFPTETVYGIAVRADDPRAIARLFEVKGRPDAKPMAYHVGSITAFERLVPDPPRIAQILIDRYWPGPLTL